MKPAKQRALYERVIVPLDGSRTSERALPAAVALTRATRSRLCLLSVAPYGGAHDRELYLKELAATLDPEPEIAVVVTGHADVRIVDFASRGPKSIVCMASHGRGPMAQVVLGSVAAGVVRARPGPVVLCGPNAESQDEAFRNIVVPLDGSRLGDAVIPTAFAWSSAPGVTLHLVQVVAPDAGQTIEALDIRGGDIMEAAYVKGDAAALIDQGALVNWDVLHDRDPAAGIVRFGRQLPRALIMMSTHGRSGLALAALGSVATRVVHDAPCPVAVLRPQPAAS